MVYDDSLEDKLSKVGLQNINSVNWGESDLIPLKIRISTSIGNLKTCY